MAQPISNLADYNIVAWVIEPDNWRLVFDSSDGESVIQHELSGVSRWRTSELRDAVGVIDIRVNIGLNGALTYTINTVCNEIIEVVCAHVHETHIKHTTRKR